jgi:glycosyltransferase involved in cell wall biosynthesis
MMRMAPTITIIIPVYNRDKLLHFTLDSIIKQTFTDWECILVDDRSTDESLLVLHEYQKTDPRFKVFLRPEPFRKGANSCRNYGFLHAKGSYIKWFDSDDIMLEKHLEIAHQTIVKNNLDFVVTDTVNFNHENGEILDKPYNFDRMEAIITPENFAKNKIGWITDDFLGKRKLLEKIKFNENITTDGDEYNFFVRLLHQSNKGVFINKILTHRRIHQNSLSNINAEHTKVFLSKVATIKYQTAKDLVVYHNVELIRWFLSGYMQYAFKLANKKESILFWIPAFKLICTYYSFIKGGAFIVALGGARFFRKGYNIMKYARK